MFFLSNKPCMYANKELHISLLDSVMNGLMISYLIACEILHFLEHILQRSPVV